MIKETTIGGEKKDVWQFEAEKAEYFNLDSLRLDEAKLYRLQIHYKIEDVCRDINGFAEKFYVQIGDVRYEFGGERGYCGQINRLMKGSERISVGSVGRGTLCIADVKVEEIKFFIKLSSFELQRMETTGEFDDTEVLKSIDAPNFSQISFSFKATKTPSYVGYFFVRMKNEEGDIVREIRIYDREEFMKFAYSYALPEGTESLDFGIAGAAAGNFSAIYLYK